MYLIEHTITNAASLNAVAKVLRAKGAVKIHVPFKVYAYIICHNKSIWCNEPYPEHFPVNGLNLVRLNLWSESCDKGNVDLNS